MGGRAKNIEKPKVFTGFLDFWETRKRSLRHLRGCLGRCWLEGCVFLKLFGHVSDKVANKRGKMATKRVNMATKSAKMSQHERE